MQLHQNLPSHNKVVAKNLLGGVGYRTFLRIGLGWHTRITRIHFCHINAGWFGLLVVFRQRTHTGDFSFYVGHHGFTHWRRRFKDFCQFQASFPVIGRDVCCNANKLVWGETGPCYLSIISNKFLVVAIGANTVSPCRICA